MWVTNPGSGLLYCLPTVMAFMGMYKPHEASYKNSEYIEIWLGNLRVRFSPHFFHFFPHFFHIFFITALMPSDLTKSPSLSSLQSAVSATSISLSSTRAIDLDHGIKHLTDLTDAVAQPLKRSKHGLSAVSSPVISNVDNDFTLSTAADGPKTDGAQDAIEIDLDREKLEKELGTCVCYSFLALSLMYFILSGSPEKLEVPDILVLQANRHHQNTQKPSRTLFPMHCEEVQDQSQGSSAFSGQG